MMDYCLCDQCVTIYRNTGDKVTRHVVENAWFSLEEALSHPDAAPERRFLLIVPGPEVGVFVGDRVLPGIGPMQVDGESFIPANIPDLVEVGRTRHFRVGGTVCHTEAEQAWN